MVTDLVVRTVRMMVALAGGVEHPGRDEVHNQAEEGNDYRLVETD